MENLFDLNTLSGKIINEESELIPLMTSEDEEAIDKEKLPKSLSILPLKNTVLFPGVVIPITATRNKSVKLFKAANKEDKLIGVVSQINNKVSDPKIGDINNIGTVAKILRVLQMPDGNLTIIIQGKKRFKIEKILSEKPFIKADICEINEIKPQKNDKTHLFVNGMGGTPLTELSLVYYDACEILKSKGIEITRSLVGNYCTSLEMQGASITLTKCDE